MVTGSITNERFSLFEQHLRAHQRAAGTIEKYVRDVRALAAWLGGTEVTRERVAAWRDSLLARGYAPETVNSGSDKDLLNRGFVTITPLCFNFTDDAGLRILERESFPNVR